MIDTSVADAVGGAHGQLSPPYRPAVKREEIEAPRSRCSYSRYCPKGRCGVLLDGVGRHRRTGALDPGYVMRRTRHKIAYPEGRAIRHDTSQG